MRANQGRRIAIVTMAAGLAVLGVAAWLGWPHIRFRWRFEPLGRNAQGFPEYRHRRTGIVMVRLPGGRYLMGAQGDDRRAPNYDPFTIPSGINEGPVHEVVLSPFLIGKFEVTQAQWRSVMGRDPSKFRGDPAAMPVEQVSRDDIQGFLDRTGLRLPTEAQWEHACRAGSTATFSFGDDPALLGEHAWFSDNSGGTTHPVGRKRPNASGLHDLHGNVAEYCEDMWDPWQRFYAESAGARDPLNPKGPGGRYTSDCIPRGGAWSSGAPGCRSAARDGWRADIRSDAAGFRACFWPVP